MIKKILKNFAVLATLFTAFFYIVGISFNQGYLSEFGVTTKVFPLTFNEALLKGFAATVSILWSYKWHIVTVMIGIYLLLLLLAFIDDKFLKSPKNDSDNKKEEVSKNNDKTNKSLLTSFITSLEWLGNYLYIFIISLSVFVVIISGIIYVSKNFGKTTATKLKQDFKNQLKKDEENGVKIINYFLNGTEKRGVIISHSSNYILIYTEKLKPIVLDNSNIEYFKVNNQ